MRTDDIQRVSDPDSHRTERLYVPTKVGVENMTLAQLLPGLCARADMQGKQCRACGGCRFGQRLVEVRGKDLIHPCGVPSPAGEGYNPSGPCGATCLKHGAEGPGRAESPGRFRRSEISLMEVRGKDLIRPCGAPSPAGEGYNPSGPCGATFPERVSCRRKATEGFHSLDTKLTKNQMAHAECMKRQRRNRVAKARALMAAGTPESIAALAAGYGSTSAYRKAEAKCRAEARKEQNRHV